uniref:DNA oxidative demethylase ALKBH2 n=1 Tax=Lepeophtheirus salmonis TaxID=72036 RepID=D3PI54_LEPSM|nr:Alpha-ketoglutarate-dependent dioxygenase alkB homolog 2 [Lepeophtheirus salmonis]
MTLTSKKSQLKLTDIGISDSSFKSAQTDSWEKIEQNGLKLSILQDYYESSRAHKLFTSLEKEIEYLEGALSQVHVFGKWHPIPRKHVAYGDSGVNYTFSSRTISAKPWTPSLKEIRNDLYRDIGHLYNFVLVNRYENGAQKMGEHKDNEKDILKDVPIASISLGQERDFIFRHESLVQGHKKSLDPSFNKYKLSLKSGSCLLMHYPTNEYWYHGLPSRASAREPRISLTFRRIHSL